MQATPIIGNDGWIELHNHKTWINKDGEWCTYVNTDSGKRKLVRRKTKESLGSYLRDYYKSIISYKDKFKEMFSSYKEINVWDIKPATYLISSKGDIYSVPSREWRKPQIDDEYGNYKGQYRVLLQTISGEQKRFSVARLTLATYKGLPPDNMKDPTVDHKNTDPLDNHIENLRWVEREINSGIRKSRGIGETNGRAILTQDNVINICNDLIKHKSTIAEEAKKYGVSEYTIKDIVNHKTWRYISELFQFEEVT